MISRVQSDQSTCCAMVRWLGALGQALVDYQWTDMRDWINSVLQDVGQGRITWLDHNVIAERLNTAKLRASVGSAAVDPTIPVCAQFNQGTCRHDSTHGVFKHICALCWIAQGSQYTHSAQTCRRKGGNQQNNRSYQRDTAQPTHTGQQAQGNRYHGGYQGRDRKNHDSPGSYAQENSTALHAKN